MPPLWPGPNCWPCKSTTRCSTSCAIVRPTFPSGPRWPPPPPSSNRWPPSGLASRASATRSPVGRRHLEKEVADLERRRADLDRKLSTGTVPKELATLAHEVDTVKARIGELEDAEIELMEAIEPLDAEHAQLGQAERAAAERGDLLRVDLARGVEAIAVELTREQAARDEAAAEVPAGRPPPLRRAAPAPGRGGGGPAGRGALHRVQPQPAHQRGRAHPPRGPRHPRAVRAVRPHPRALIRSCCSGSWVAPWSSPGRCSAIPPSTIAW